MSIEKISYFHLSKNGIFEYKHNFPNKTISFVFNLDKIVEIISKDNHKDEFAVVPLDDIQKYNARALFAYDPPNTIINVNKGNHEPIICVPIFWAQDTSFIVIDGNHRVAKEKLLNKKTIKAYVLQPMIAHDCIIGEFEKELYGFFVWALKFM